MSHITFIPGTPDVVIFCISFKAGSIYEAPQKRGISHLLEHMLFRSKSNASSKQMSNILQNLGGNYNAFTTFDVTSYYIQGHKEHWKKYVDVLSKIVCDPSFTQEDLDHERSVVLEEIAFRSGNSQKEMLINLFCAGTPYGFDVAGTSETLSTITLEDVRNYYKKHYAMCYVTVSCPTNLEAPIRSYLTPKFSKKTCMQNFNEYIDLAQIRPTSFPIVLWRSVSSSPNNITLGFRGFAYSKNVSMMMNLLCSIIQERLTFALREKEASTYTVEVDTIALRHLGALMINFMTTKPILPSFKALLDVLKQLRETFVPKEKFARLKDAYVKRQRANYKGKLEDVVGNALHAVYGFEGIVDFHAEAKVIAYEDMKQFCTMCLEFGSSCAMITSSEKNALKEVVKNLKRCV